jgi:hypothetical protein
MLMILWVTYTTLLEDLLPGPSFVPIVLVAALFVPLLYAELRGHYHLSRLLGLGDLAVLARFAKARVLVDPAIGPARAASYQIQLNTPAKSQAASGYQW